MSSAILYLAIVAIWAIVLVPRWLRHAPHRPVQQNSTDAGEAGQDAPAGTVVSQPNDASWPDPAARRARILRARRRMLAALVVITAGSVIIAALHLAAPWVIVPPALMLGGFLLLLREAARSDAEQARRAAAREGRAEARPTRTRRAEGRPAQAPPARGQPPQSQPAAQAAVAEAGEAVVTSTPAVGGAEGGSRETVPAAPAVPGAEIIDLSARINDQLYDQYSDAAERAIGD